MPKAAELGEAITRILSLARHEASRLGEDRVAPAHLLLALTRLGEDCGVRLLRDAGLGADRLRADLTAQSARHGLFAPKGALDLSPRCEAVLVEALAERRRTAAERDGASLCLLAGILRADDGPARTILERHGVGLAEVERLIEERVRERGSAAGAETPLLARFGRDLTALAERGALDPLVGRDAEVQQVLQTLLQRIKRNPLLVGEPGVGKTAMVEGLAQRIVAGEVPAALAGRRLVALDLGSLIAGTRYRGEFEERLRGVLEELRSTGEHVLFIDEIHTLVGAGAVDGSLDAANLLKPALADGGISCIGATTPREFRRYLERDRALLRRFQRIAVEPPSLPEAVAILRGLRPRYEEFHALRIGEGALDAAVHHAHRYLSERHLPDKAIDLIDRAAALHNLRAAAASPSPGDPAAATELTAREVEEVLATTTGIPLERLRESEAERLATMETVLARRVIGQDAALGAVARALRRSRLGLRDPRRPIGSFLFVGTSGVGKTEVARRLAEFLFEREDALVRFDMSEYMERHAVAKLIGSPPGYVGYEDGGLLTEAVRNQPYCVVLLDEIEKAHPDVGNILLQIFEDGRLSDSSGNVVDFTNTLVLMTSNVGTRTLLDNRPIGFTSATGRWQHLDAALKGELKRAFRPELLDRLDEVVVFRPLGRDELRRVVALQLDEVAALLTERGTDVEWGDGIEEWLLERAEIDRETGARPIRRAVQRFVQDRLSEELLERGDPAGLLRVSVDGDRLTVSAGRSGDDESGH